LIKQKPLPKLTNPKPVVEKVDLDDEYETDTYIPKD